MNISNVSKKALKILFVASEAAPFVKVGGLGEIMCSLPKALRELGHDARVFFPKYASINPQDFNFESLELEVGSLAMASPEKDPHGLLVCNILRNRDERGNIIAYLLENMEYYEKRANVYGYNDDTTRWVLLSRAVLEFLKKSEWKPDIIVANDWQTGFVPNLLKTEYKDDPVLSKIPVVFCIHNLHHQGMFEPLFISEIDYDSGQGPVTEFFDPGIWKLNGIRRGILCADAVNTVSPSYAKEILLPEFGEKLDEVLRERRGHLSGILNGIDFNIFNPRIDPIIAARFDSSDLKARIQNKTALQKRMGLAEAPEKFILGYIGRLDEQKGINIFMPIADALMENLDIQLVIVGTGDNQYRLFFQELRSRYPERVATNLFFDAELPHIVCAGADSIMIPSRFEPSGLVQMEAMRYGAVPVVRQVGGLADSVSDYSPEKNEGTGFVFKKYEPNALLIAILRAYETFRHKKEWESLMKRIMKEDFSWQKSAKDYLALFQKVILSRQS